MKIRLKQDGDKAFQKREEEKKWLKIEKQNIKQHKKLRNKKEDVLQKNSNITDAGVFKEKSVDDNENSNSILSKLLAHNSKAYDKNTNQTILSSGKEKKKVRKQRATKRLALSTKGLEEIRRRSDR